MTALPLLMARLLNQPLLCDPSYVEVALSAISDRLNIEPLVDAAEMSAPYRRPAKEGYIDRATGIAILPIIGSMAHRSDNVSPMSGLVGYTAIHNTLTDYLHAPNIRGVLLDVDSPGGEVAGMSELADLIAEFGQDKPIYAIANSMMCSAAYWLCSGATRIYAAPNAMVGSIGVVTAHVDRSKELEKRGQKVTLIHAGKHKVEGNPYEALPDDVRAGVQARVDHLYSQFVATVAERRGLEEKAVRNTEAGVFSPETASEIGLIDGVATFGEALRALQSRVSGPSFSSGVSATKESQTMAERLTYGENDISRAREEGRAEANAAASTKADQVIAKAKADLNEEMATAIATLFPDNPRAGAFVDALKDGASVVLATKVAARIAVVDPKAEADTPRTRTDADLDRIMQANAPGIAAEGDGTQMSAREKRLAEIASVAKGHNLARGYINR